MSIHRVNGFLTGAEVGEGLWLLLFGEGEEAGSFIEEGDFGGVKEHVPTTIFQDIAVMGVEVGGDEKIHWRSQEVKWLSYYTPLWAFVN
jgi:hypothetical protein